MTALILIIVMLVLGSWALATAITAALFWLGGISVSSTARRTWQTEATRIAGDFAELLLSTSGPDWPERELAVSRLFELHQHVTQSIPTPAHEDASEICREIFFVLLQATKRPAAPQVRLALQEALREISKADSNADSKRSDPIKLVLQEALREISKANSKYSDRTTDAPAG